MQFATFFALLAVCLALFASVEAKAGAHRARHNRMAKHRTQHKAQKDVHGDFKAAVKKYGKAGKVRAAKTDDGAASEDYTEGFAVTWYFDTTKCANEESVIGIALNTCYDGIEYTCDGTTLTLHEFTNTGCTTGETTTEVETDTCTSGVQFSCSDVADVDETLGDGYAVQTVSYDKACSEVEVFYGFPEDECIMNSDTSYDGDYQIISWPEITYYTDAECTDASGDTQDVSDETCTKSGTEYTLIYSTSSGSDDAAFNAGLPLTAASVAVAVGAYFMN